MASVRAAEGERGQGGTEMTETSHVMVCPQDSVIVLDGEGVDSVKGLEIMEVR